MTLEHACILRVVGSLESCARCAAAGEPLPRHIVASYAEFFAGFADRFSGGGEERRLFARLGQGSGVLESAEASDFVTGAQRYAVWLRTQIGMDGEVHDPRPSGDVPVPVELNGKAEALLARYPENFQPVDDSCESGCNGCLNHFCASRTE